MPPNIVVPNVVEQTVFDVEVSRPMRAADKRGGGRGAPAPSRNGYRSGDARRRGRTEEGAWHFHLLLFVGPSVGALKGLRRFVSTSWYEVTGKASEGHLRAGTRVEAVRRWKEATSYAERYVAKPEGFPAGSRTGRLWGIWGGQLLPVRWEEVEIALRDAFRIRRIYRKRAKRKGGGPLRRITVFVRHENAFRLLGYLGYRLE